MSGFIMQTKLCSNRKADAIFEGVGRTVATNYDVHGVDVQSKYINGATIR